MFVYTKYLSLMELVSRPAGRPLEVEAFAKSRERSSSGFIERLPLADQGLQPFSEKSAHGAPFLGRQDAGFTEQVGVKLEGDVGFRIGFPC
jgi:hypothetical protein